MENTELLKVDHLTKRYPVPGGFFRRGKAGVLAVSDVSFSIRSGETLGLVGESGCGKSTLGRTILRLIPKTSGTVLFEGRDMESLSGSETRLLRRKMQIIFQDPYSCLNPRMNVKELVKAPLDVFKIGTEEERVEKVTEMLDIVGMGKQHLSRYPHEFSGGQRQRIGIARALICRPEFVVCDEPVSALDVSVRASVLNLLSRLQKHLGLTYLFISHDLSVVKHISDRVAVMYLGNMVELAGKDDLYEHPLHPYTQALLSAIPDPYRRTKPLPLKGDLPSPYSPPSGCRFHTRCRYSCRRCELEAPKFGAVSGGHFVACHLYD